MEISITLKVRDAQNDTLFDNLWQNFAFNHQNARTHFQPKKAREISGVCDFVHINQTCTQIKIKSNSEKRTMQCEIVATVLKL